jgi:hypothetical protein
VQREGDTIWIGGDVAPASRRGGAVTFVAVDHLIVAAATLATAWPGAKRRWA